MEYNLTGLLDGGDFTSAGAAPDLLESDNGFGGTAHGRRHRFKVGKANVFLIGNGVLETGGIGRGFGLGKDRIPAGDGAGRRVSGCWMG